MIEKTFVCPGFYKGDIDHLFRVQSIEQLGYKPTIVIATSPDVPSVMLPVYIPMVAAELITHLCPHRLDELDEAPVLFLERYESAPGARELSKPAPNWAEVTFASWMPRKVSIYGTERKTLGTPSWRQARPCDLDRLFGAGWVLDELPF